MIGSRPALFPVWHLAGWTILHFIWVGSLVAVLAALGRQILRRAHPDVRYANALASLTLLAAAPAVLRGVTPVSYARRYPDRRCVNARALAAVIERGGKE